MYQQFGNIGPMRLIFRLPKHYLYRTDYHASAISGHQQSPFARGYAIRYAAPKSLGFSV